MNKWLVLGIAVLLVIAGTVVLTQHGITFSLSAGQGNAAEAPTTGLTLSPALGLVGLAIGVVLVLAVVYGFQREGKHHHGSSAHG